MGLLSPGVLGVVASSAFKAESRKNGMFDASIGRPGPGDYLTDKNTVSMGNEAERFRIGI